MLEENLEKIKYQVLNLSKFKLRFLKFPNSTITERIQYGNLK